jgi:hypothetical protein
MKLAPVDRHAIEGSIEDRWLVGSLGPATPSKHHRDQRPGHADMIGDVLDRDPALCRCPDQSIANSFFTFQRAP